MELNMFDSQATAANSICLLVTIFLVASPEHEEHDGGSVNDIDIKCTKSHLSASLSMK